MKISAFQYAPVFLAVAGLIAGCATMGPSAVAPDRTVVILLHDNDLHFDFNHREAFEQAVAGFRDTYDNVFLLNAGDIFVRHPRHWPVDDMAFYAERSRYMIETMNALGYAAATPGNHELDYKETYTRDALRLAQFPLLGANVEVSTDNFDPLEPYTVLTTDSGHTLAVLGLTYLNADPGGIAVRPPAEVVEEYLHLRDEHDVFIVLSHIGVTNDRALAEQFSEIDVIVGGHSHTLLAEAEMVNGVLVAQAGFHPHKMEPDRPKYLGVVRLVLEDGVVVEKSGFVLAEGLSVALAAEAAHAE